MLPEDPLKTHLQVFFGITLLFFSGFYAAKANLNLVLPAYTHHIQHNQHKEYNEGFDNTALGIDYTKSTYSAAAIYVHKNSHSKHSLYTYALWHTNTTLQLGTGALFAVGGYETPLASPVIALRYKWVQLITTYPTAKLIGLDTDLLNIQLIIPLGD